MLRKFTLLLTLLSSFSVFAANYADQAFNERYGIFFVFESTCSSCLRLAPLLNDYATKHDIFVKAISKDGKGLYTWPRAWTADKNGFIYRLGAEKLPTPALYLFDSETKQSLPIGIGTPNEQELNERIHQLTNINLGESQ